MLFFVPSKYKKNTHNKLNILLLSLLLMLLLIWVFMGGCGLWHKQAKVKSEHLKSSRTNHNPYIYATSYYVYIHNTYLYIDIKYIRRAHINGKNQLGRCLIYEYYFFFTIFLSVFFIPLHCSMLECMRNNIQPIE